MSEVDMPKVAMLEVDALSHFPSARLSGCWHAGGEGTRARGLTPAAHANGSLVR